MRFLYVTAIIMAHLNLFSQAIGYSDCDIAMTPCSSEFAINDLIGIGNIQDPINERNCFEDNNPETNSIWIKFEITISGSFEFELTPLSATDDIDFIVFKKNSQCSNLIPLRCMASGKNLGTIYNNSQRCTGKTGIVNKSSDLSELSGCYGLADNFLSSFNCTVGDSYLILINNYNSERGVKFKFNGSANFKTNSYPRFERSMSLNNEIWSYSLFHKSSQGLGGCSVEWNIIDELESQNFQGLRVNDIKFKIPGNKIVIRKISNIAGCVYADTSTIQVSTITSNLRKKNEITLSEVYPNPAKTVIYLEVFNPSQKSLSFNITNIDGKEITQSEKILTENYQVISKKIDDLPSGIYFINLIEKNGKKLVHSKKFIITQ